MMMACPNWRRYFWPTFTALLAATLVFLLVQGYFTYQRFVSQTTLTISDIQQLYNDSADFSLATSSGQLTFLLLGTDTLEYRQADYPLTDTIILATLDVPTATINLLSLPRDIYLPDYGGKINSLYANNYQVNPITAIEQTTAQFSSFFALPIDYTFVVGLADIAAYIDLLGGVEVDIVNSFTDYQYPRSDVDVTTVTDPALLYQTISFTAGPNFLDSTQALQYIRSRHGDNGEGSDYARSARQQILLNALTQTTFDRLLSELSTLNFTFLGQLYNFYGQRYSQQLPFVELLALARLYLDFSQPLTLHSHSLAINPPDVSANLRESPASYANNYQWSLTITDLPGLIQEIHQKLSLGIPSTQD